eukprot:15350219-Ditylum_brightwellii.AAC.1
MLDENCILRCVQNALYTVWSGKYVPEAKSPEAVATILEYNTANQDKSATKLDESVGKEKNCKVKLKMRGVYRRTNTIVVSPVG